MSAILTITGRVGKDPETRTTGGGQNVVSFSVATNDGYGDKQTTSWWDISVWDKLAESVPKFVKKGALVSVTGKAKVTEYQGKRRVEITGLVVERLDTKSEGEKSNTAAAPAQARATRPAAQPAARPAAAFDDGLGIDDSDIPF